MLKTDSIVVGRNGSSGAYGATGSGTPGHDFTGTQHTAISNSSVLANKADFRVNINHGKLVNSSTFALKLNFQQKKVVVTQLRIAIPG